MNSYTMPYYSEYGSRVIKVNEIKIERPINTIILQISEMYILNNLSKNKNFKLI